MSPAEVIVVEAAPPVTITVEATAATVIEVEAPGPQGPPGPPGPSTETAIAEHVADGTPHPAYDDLPSLTLIFENGLI